MTCRYFYLFWDGFWNFPFHPGWVAPVFARDHFQPDDLREASGPHVLQHTTLGGVNSRGTRVKPDHRRPLPLGWLNLPNPFTSCELEEKPSSLRLELSLAVGLSAEATGPISLCAPLWVSFCFLASFLWDMCKGKNHSQMVTVASKSWKIRLLFSHPSSTPKPGALSRNRVKAGPPRSRWDKPKSFWNF